MVDSFNPYSEADSADAEDNAANEQEAEPAGKKTAGFEPRTQEDFFEDSIVDRGEDKDSSTGERGQAKKECDSSEPQD